MRGAIILVVIVVLAGALSACGGPGPCDGLAEIFLYSKDCLK